MSNKGKKTKPNDGKIVKGTENKQEESVQDEVIKSDEIITAEQQEAEKTEATSEVKETDKAIEEEDVAETVAEETDVKETVSDKEAIAQEKSADEFSVEETVKEKDVEIEKAAVIIEEEAQSQEVVLDDAKEDAPGAESVTVEKSIEELPSDEPKFVEIDESKVVEQEVIKDKNEEEEKASEVKEEEPQPTDTEGELVPHEKDKKEAKEDKNNAPKGPSKFALFLKKNKLIFIIAAIVLVLAAAAVTTYFILTKDLVFVKSAEDIINADKGHTLVFKSDITVDNDITIEGYSLDLNGKTFTVVGTLTLNGKGSDTINIGDRKRKEYIAGGVISADTIVINGMNNLVALRAKAVADAIFINTANVELYGNIEPLNNANSVVSISNNSAVAMVSSHIDGNINLGTNVDLEFRGSVVKISSGKVITVYDGATAALIADAQKAVLYPHSNVDELSNVVDFVFVEYLAAPELLIVKEGNLFVCYVSEVKNAAHYDYSIDGQTGRIAATEDSFVLPELSPGRYNLSVTAGSTNESYNSAQATTIIEVHYTVKLNKPAINITKTGDTVNLIIAEVDNATEYVYTINGKEYAPVNAGTIDISDKVEGIGKYTVYAYARNSADNSYEESNKAMTSYINSVTLIMSEVTVTYNEVEDNYTAEWTAVDNANYYRIEENGVITYTRATSYIFSADSITILATGRGFYINSTPIVVTKTID